MILTKSQSELLEAFRQDGCAICRVVTRSVDRSLEAINYELVIDPQFRSKLDAAWGFCNQHAHQWLKRAHPLGTAQIYDAILGRISNAISDLKPPRSGLLSRKRTVNDRAMLDELTSKGACPLCEARDEHEQLSIHALLNGLSENEFRLALAASSGLCLAHLRLGLASSPDPATFETLRADALKREQVLRVQLQEIVRKHDYRFRDEPTGEERGATERAVRHVAGERSS